MSAVNYPIFSNGILTTTPVSLYAIPAFIKIRMDYENNEWRDVMREFVAATCCIMRVTEQQLMGKSRKGPITRARMYIMLLMRQYTLATTTQIGAALMKDHTTVLHGVRTIRDRIRFEEPVANEFQRICAKLGVAYITEKQTA